MGEVKRRKHRPGELSVMYFDKLPPRAKELFFEFMSCEYEYNGDKSFFVDIWSMEYEECKSPIEIILNVAYDIKVFTNISLGISLFLTPQKHIDANGHHYIADFVFDTNDLDDYVNLTPFKLVIECDGHDFHERTKEQVKMANERDFDLKMEGYEVLHFSGSQIFNEPFKCAQEIVDFIKMKVKVVGGDSNGQRVDMLT